MSSAKMVIREFYCMGPLPTYNCKYPQYPERGQTFGFVTFPVGVA